LDYISRHSWFRFIKFANWNFKEDYIDCFISLCWRFGKIIYVESIYGS